MRIMKWLLVLLVTMGSGIVNAMEGPKVAYSADSYMETADGVQQGTVNYAPGMERREFEMNGEKMVMIMRHDKNLIWTLMPGNMYMEMKIPEEGRADDLSSYKFETTTMGQETVNGMRTTKNKMIMTGPNGEKMGGFSWVTADGIMVKLDAIAVDKKKKDRFKLELKNIQIGKQDRDLFEVPDGYEKMDMMGGLGAMMKGGDDDEDNGDGDDQQNHTTKEKKKGFSIKDAIDIFK